MKKIIIGAAIMAVCFFLVGNWKIQSSTMHVTRLDKIKRDYFRNGDTLLPDDVVKDTLIVFQADSLNRATKVLASVMPEYVEDDSIKTVFYKWCRKL